MLTLGWTNIPQCIPQAINILLDKINANSTEIQELKSALTDLTIKFQVKTNRLDSALQEQAAQLKASLPWVKEEISTLQVKFDSINSNMESRFKPITETLNDQKQKLSQYISELKKDIKETNNKIESLKQDFSNKIEEFVDKVFDKIHSYDLESQKKIQSIVNQNSIVFENTEKMFEKIKEDFSLTQIKLNEQKDNFSAQSFFLEKLKRKIEKAQMAIDSTAKEQENLRDLIESLTKVPEPIPVTQNSPPERKQTKNRQETVINPIFDKIRTVEEKLEESLMIFLKKLEESQISTQSKILENQCFLQTWTIEKVSSSISENFKKIKDKLEWLPDSSSPLKGMGVTEARIFLIESRIREEEKQRILSDKQIFDLVSDAKNRSANLVNQRRSSLSPGQSKCLSVNIDKKPIIQGKRPNSSYNHRDIVSQEKLKERLLIKV